MKVGWRFETMIFVFSSNEQYVLGLKVMKMERPRRRKRSCHSHFCPFMIGLSHIRLCQVLSTI